MKISASKPEAVVLSWKRVGYSLQVRGETLPLVKENHLRILFMSNGKSECETGFSQEQ